jgi:hypothetical protein
MSLIPCPAHVAGLLLIVETPVSLTRIGEMRGKIFFEDRGGMAGSRQKPAVRGRGIRRLSSTHSRPSAVAVGTALHAPFGSFADARRIGSVGEGFRMPAGGDLSAGAEGRRPKAPQEGTRGGWVSSLPSMGIYRGGGLRRGCAGRRNRRRSDDRGREGVVAAAVDGVNLA